VDAKHLFLSNYRKLTTLAEWAVANWSVQWSILLVGLSLLLLFFTKERPIRSFIGWAKKSIGRIYQLLKRKRNERQQKKKHSPLASLFEAIKLLTGNYESRYKIPTYVALPVGTDIKAVMQGLNSGQRQQLILQQHKQKQDNNDWFIFDKACVICLDDVDELCHELSQYRPERPIDGIIISIAESKLQSQNHAQLESESNEIFGKIVSLQQSFGFVLPVYIVITDCEGLPGFKQFWQLKGLEQHHDGIIGWSNHLDPEKTYDNNWIKIALGEISKRLRKIQLNFIRDKDYTPSAHVLLLPDRVMALASGLEHLCQTLFSASSYHNAFMFRGIYCVGKISSKGPVKFVQELFSQKIFAEPELAYPPQNKLFSSNNKLRMYQYVSAACLLLLGSLLTFDSIKLNDQTRNLVKKIQALPPIPLEQNKRDATYVKSVLDHIGDMNANNLGYVSIPWSWSNDFDLELVDYFSRDVFKRIVFPAFECRINEQLKSAIDHRPAPAQIQSWLQRLQQGFNTRDQLYGLMLRDDLSTIQAAHRFGYIEERLYNKKLPADFYKNAPLYFDALRSRVYLPQTMAQADHKRPAFCKPWQQDNLQLWQQIDRQVVVQLEQSRQQVTAPAAFFQQLTALQSLPSDMSWDQVLGDFSLQIGKYMHWSKVMNDNWLAGNAQHSSCQQVQQTITKLADFLDIQLLAGRSMSADYLALCEAKVQQQMLVDDKLLLSGLYQFEENRVVFSEAAHELLTSVKQIATLPFVQKPLPKPEHADGQNYFWSAEHLQGALDMFKQYKSFAGVHFDKLKLAKVQDVGKHEFLAQAVTLKQLQLAMQANISNARLANISATSVNLLALDQKEEQIRAYAANFSQAMPLLLELYQAFADLGLADSQSWLRQITSGYVLSQLYSVDQLYQENKLYLPLAKPHWEAEQYVKALYGIEGSGQLQDYLAAQSQRAEHIGFNYAKPLLQYLNKILLQSATAPDMAISAKDHQLYSLWLNTLDALNKQQNKDPLNSQAQLAQFFNNQLFNTNQDNCYEQGKSYTRPQQNNLFAIEQNKIISQALKHCHSFTTEQILQEYQQVFQDFNRLLANKYPFAAQQWQATLTPIAIHAFMQQYPGQSSGLYQRMQQLVKNSQENPQLQQYVEAMLFVQKLDNSLAFFDKLFAVSGSAKGSGLELAVDFNVMEQVAVNGEHIVNWALSTANKQLTYPGSEQQKLYWLPGEPVDLHLNWAKNSPYKARAIQGATQENQLVFAYQGNKDNWSLLHFIQQYAANVQDSLNLDPAANLLNFEAKLFNRETSSFNPPRASVFMRITLYAQDEITKQSVSVPLPASFPANAPAISTGAI